jgi:DGQHR domain-containing protein
MIPNAIVLALGPNVNFTPQTKDQQDTPSIGILRIPLEANQSEKAAWIVDGQQRVAAIRNSRVASFPMSVVGFIAENENTQREQFILVNSAKPLPKDLIDELITETTEPLGTVRDKKKFLLTIRNRLNFDKDSPFEGRIKTPTVPKGYISSSSILKMIENSITNGALFAFRGSDKDMPQREAIVMVLKKYWKAVAATFPEAWENPPTKSRLTHGAGIVSMGFIMDTISARYPSPDSITSEDFTKEVEMLSQTCNWTSGQWEFGPEYKRKWNDIQNISKDIELLANYLVTRFQNLRAQGIS